MADIGPFRKGATPPADGSKFDLLINSKTAAKLGLAIPPELIVLADEVIECAPPMSAIGPKRTGAFALQMSAFDPKRTRMCIETAGSSMDQVLKCNVYCTSVDMFATVNAIYALLPQKSSGQNFC